MLFYLLKSTRALLQASGALVLGLLAVGLLFTTVFRWRYEATLREGIRSSATAESDAQTTLADAAGQRKDDPLPSLYLGHVLVERGMKAIQEADLKAEDPYAIVRRALQQAVKSFEAAQEKRDRTGAASSDSAIVGAAVAELYLADISPSERTALLSSAKGRLDRARDGEDPDVLVAKAGLAIASADLATAQKLLGDAEGKLENAGRGAAGSYYWQKGMLGLIAKDANALADLKRAALIRPSNDAAKLIALAMRINASDPAALPKEPRVLEDRCAAIASSIGQRVRGLQGGRNRWGLDRPMENTVWNAVGMGYMKVPNVPEAKKAFQNATSSANPDITHLLNLALCVLATADSPPPGAPNPELHKFRVYGEAGLNLRESTNALIGKEDKKKLGRDVCLLAGGLLQKARRYSDGLQAMHQAHDRFGLEEKEYARHKGAFLDWSNRLDQAVVEYKKAIELGHKDTYKMQTRIDMFERRR